MEGIKPEFENPPHSEVSESFLRKFASSPSAISDFQRALLPDEEDDVFPSIPYEGVMEEFKLADLVRQYSVTHTLILLTLISSILESEH